MLSKGGRGGGDPGKHGALKSVVQMFLREIETHSGSVYTDSGCYLGAQSRSLCTHSGYVCRVIGRRLCMQL